MIQDDLQKILFKKYQDKKLASLYIANYDTRALDPKLWVNEFQNLFTKITDHPDILKIHKSEKETEYKVDSNQIRDLLKFINYKPLQLEKKLIFLFDAHDISTILSNKLLKIFEELGSNFCLFLMVPDNAFMLPTVLSRAIKLKIHSSNELTSKISNFSSVHTPQELLVNLKQSGDNASQDEKKFIEERIEHCLSQSNASKESFQKLDELLKILADYEKYSNFNNSKLARLARFFS